MKPVIWYTSLHVVNLILSGEASCTCATPCTRVLYTPELSYAHLSRSNVGSILPADEQGQYDLQTRYIHAREVSHHVIPMYKRKNTKLFGKINGLARKYLTVVKEVDATLKDDEYFGSKSGLSDSLLTTVSKAGDDVTKLDAYYLGTLNSVLDDYVDINDKPWSAMQDVRITLHDQVLYQYEPQRLCVEQEASGISNPAICQSAFIPNYIFQVIVRYLNLLLPSLWNLKMSYVSKIDTIYDNSTGYDDAIMKQDYKTCLDVLGNLSSLWADKTIELKSALNNYTITLSSREKLNILNIAYEYYNLTYSNESIYNEQLYTSCEWFQRPDLADTTHFNFLSTTAGSENGLKQGISSAATMGQDLVTLLESNSENLFSVYGNYLSDYNDTKVSLYQYTVSTEYLDKWESVINRQARLESVYSDIVTSYEDLITAIKSMVDYYDNSSLPLKTRYVHRLDFVQIAFTQLQNNTNARHYLSLIEVDNRAALQGLVEEVYDTYGYTLERTLANLTQSFRDMNYAVTKANEYLEEFVEENELNANFVL